MPRQSRLELPGSLHHIMARGIDGQDIFKNTKDLDHFKDRLGNLVLQSSNECFAWALMKNHFHLLIRSGDEPLSRMMRRLLTGHAVYFNHRHKRSGHLFQNRFKSILCQEDTYFLQLVRYIHLNPIRSGEVKTIKTLNKYPYTGHAYINGTLENEWQNTQYPLQWFGKQKKKSLEKFLNFIKEGLSAGKQEDLTGGGLLRTVGGWKKLQELKKSRERVLGDERMLGDTDFIADVWKKARKEKAVPATKRNKEIPLEMLVKKASEQFDIDVASIRSSCKLDRVRRIKSIICYTAVQILSYSLTDVAGYLNIHKSSVSRLVSVFKHDTNSKQFIKLMNIKNKI
jgi:putative transposase